MVAHIEVPLSEGAPAGDKPLRQKLRFCHLPCQGSWRGAQRRDGGVLPPSSREVARRQPRRKEFTPSVSLRSTAPSQREPLYKGAFVFRFIPAARGRRGSAENSAEKYALSSPAGTQGWIWSFYASFCCIICREPCSRPPQRQAPLRYGRRSRPPRGTSRG